MSTVRLNAGLPKGRDRNGLEDIAADAVENPTTKRLAIVVLDTRAIVDDIDTADQVARLRLLRVEPIGPGKTRHDLQRMMLAANETRTGKQVLDLGTAVDVDLEFERWASPDVDTEDDDPADPGVDE